MKPLFTEREIRGGAIFLPLALLAAFTAACVLLLMKKGPGMLRAL